MFRFFTIRKWYLWSWIGSLIILSSCNDKKDIVSGGYNDAPEIVTRFIIISEDETVTITEQMLNASDVDDTDENITLTVSAVSHGEFQLNSVMTTHSFSTKKIFVNRTYS